MIITFSIGGFLIYTGLTRGNEKNVNLVQEKLDMEEEKLLEKKSSIEEKIKPIEDEIKKLETSISINLIEMVDRKNELVESIKEEQKSIYIIEEALDTSFNHCLFDEAKNNENTEEYCALKNKLLNIKDPENSYTYYIFGGFIILVGILYFIVMLSNIKGREIASYKMQQMMPLAKESLEEMAPTIGDTSAVIAEKMAPAYGKIAKEITKGIKSELDSDKKDEK